MARGKLWTYDKASGRWIPHPDVVAFADWWADPNRTMTIEQWAQENDFNVEVLRLIRKDHRFKLLLERKYIEYNLSPDRLQAVVAAMYDKAIFERNVPAAEWVLKYLARFEALAKRAEKVAAELAEDSEVDVSQLSDEELAEVLADIGAAAEAAALAGGSGTQAGDSGAVGG